MVNGHYTYMTVVVGLRYPMLTVAQLMQEHILQLSQCQ